MWSNERSPSFEGEYYRIKDAICNPKPIQKPHPIIMVGGSGEKYLLKVAAKHADRYNLFFGSPNDMKRKISVLKEYCKSLESSRGVGHHKDIQYSVVLPCIIRDSEEEVYQTRSDRDQTKSELVSSVRKAWVDDGKKGILVCKEDGIGFNVFGGHGGRCSAGCMMSMLFFFKLFVGGLAD